MHQSLYAPRRRRTRGIAQHNGHHATVRQLRGRLCNPVHRAFTRLARLMDMAIQRNEKDEREKRLDILTEQFRAAEKRALLKRGIELWTRTEIGTIDQAPRPVAKIN